MLILHLVSLSKVYSTAMIMEYALTSYAVKCSLKHCGVKLSIS